MSISIEQVFVPSAMRRDQKISSLIKWVKMRTIMDSLALSAMEQDCVNSSPSPLPRRRELLLSRGATSVMAEDMFMRINMLVLIAVEPEFALLKTM